MPDSILPQTKWPKLIVVVALDPDDDGELFSAFDPADYQSEDRAVRTARSPATPLVSGDVPDVE